MKTRDTRNPCVGSCRFDANAECRGCHRTKAEVKSWKRLPDTDKAAINDRIRDRIRTRGASSPPQGKRLRKLDQKIHKLEAKLDALRGEREALAGTGVPQDQPEKGAPPLLPTGQARAG